jgi:uncharacterized protein with predicted RNA binding PUA domain
MSSIDNALQRVQSVADYQFGRGVGEALFPSSVEILFSKATGRIRYVNLNGERLATLRPTNGLFSLSVVAAKLMVERLGLTRYLVTVRSEVAKYVADGGDVFAAHVVKVDDCIHSRDEVIIVDEGGKVVAVGRALLSSYELRAFTTGVGVKVRHGCGESWR